MSNTKRLLAPALLAASLLCIGNAASAQAPATSQAPPAQQAASVEQKPALSPLEEMVRGQRDERWRRSRGNLRRSLEEAGFADEKLQDAVAEFAQQQDEAREVLRQAAARASEAVRNTELADAELARVLESYQSEAAKAQAEREASLEKLDEKVGWKKKPRLALLLRLKGLLGSEAWLSGDALVEQDSFDLRILYPEPEAQ